MSYSAVRLGVNLDHVITLRQARYTPYPDFSDAIEIAERAGADGITIHLREDRRHIQDADVYLAKEKVCTSLNLEMAATDEMVAIACDVNPNCCCIVPERREELTTEGGLNVIEHENRLRRACSTLAEHGIHVSLFIEPDIEIIEKTIEIGVPVIELHTGEYANPEKDKAYELERIVRAAEYAAENGLIVNAGHGLHRDNVQTIATIPQMHELNIGHAIISDAVFMGLAQAVSAMKTAMQK